MDKIDQYFDKAKKVNEVIPLDEIESLILHQMDMAQLRSSGLSYSLLHPKAFVRAAFAVLTILCVSILTFLVMDSTDHEDGVFIPDGQKRVMQLVKNIHAQPNNSQITLSQFGSNSTPGETPIPIHLRTKFEVTADRLKLLGITVSEQFIKYEGNVKGKGYVSFTVERNRAVSVSVENVERAGIKQYEFYPWFLSDEEGVQNVRYRFRGEDSLKMANSYFFSVIDDLIPIQVTKPGFRSVIFWFSQTPELMRILESAAMVPDHSGRIDNTDRTKRLVDIHIFPTITKGHVQINAEVFSETDLEISLLNSSGQIIQVSVDKQALNEGEHKFSMDLSNFNKGLYFVRIKANHGLTTIHRLFKE